MLGLVWGAVSEEVVRRGLEGLVDLLSGYESVHADQEARRWYLWVGGQSREPTDRRGSGREEDEKVVHEVCVFVFVCCVGCCLIDEKLLTSFTSIMLCGELPSRD